MAIQLPLAGGATAGLALARMVNTARRRAVGQNRSDCRITWSRPALGHPLEGGQSRPMLLPSEYSEVRRRPAIRELLRIEVDMQFADLRTLLCLPRDEPGLGAGCNLTASTLALNIVAGASVLFWESSVDAFNERGDRGQRFKRLLEAKYPWSNEDGIDPDDGAKLMWATHATRSLTPSAWARPPNCSPASRRTNAACQLRNQSAVYQWGRPGS